MPAAPRRPRTRSATSVVTIGAPVAPAAIASTFGELPEAPAPMFAVTPEPLLTCQHGVNPYSSTTRLFRDATQTATMPGNILALERFAPRPGWVAPLTVRTSASTIPPGLYQVDPERNQRDTCYRCSDNFTNMFRCMRDYGLSALLATEEVRMGRPFTYQEWVNVVSFYANFGLGLSDFTAHITAKPTLSLLSYMAEKKAEYDRAEEERRVEAVRRQREYQRSLDRQANQNERTSRIRNANRAEALAPNDVARFALSAVPPEVSGDTVVIPQCDCDEDEDCECGNREAAYDARRRQSWLRKSAKHGTPFLARKCDRNKRLVGVELEFNTETDLTPWVLKWHGAVHSDGSCGWEGVTTPIAGGHIELCLKDLTRSLRKAGATADERCGVHVHVDSRDVRWADMLRLLKVYSKVEPLLYLIAGQHRLNQNYCKPCGPMFARAIAEKDPKDAVMAHAFRDNQLTGGRTQMRARPGKKDGGRYKGLNIIPWLVGRRNGNPDTTVEFRMHRNSLNGERVAGWAQLCAALVEYACKATDAEVNALPKSALRILAEHVSPEQRTWLIRRVLDWRRATTAERNLRSDENGDRMANRRIKLKGGVFACAV